MVTQEEPIAATLTLAGGRGGAGGRGNKRDREREGGRGERLKGTYT